MTPEQIYEIWRSTNSPWTPWVKPVLFAFLKDLHAKTRSTPEWTVRAGTGIALIVDLPGSQGIEVGMALTRHGFRPIPLYNATPFAIDPLDTTGLILRRSDYQIQSIPVAVDVLPIMVALIGATEELEAAHLPPSAPPAFLLDSNRHRNEAPPDLPWFDNRSFVAATDLPSSDFFKAHNISQVVIVQSRQKLHSDLQDVAWELEKAGLEIRRQSPWENWSPVPVTVRRSKRAQVWHFVLRKLGYRPNEAGSFGRVIRPSAG